MKRIACSILLVLVFLIGNVGVGVACDKTKDPKCGDVKIDNKVNYHPKNDVKNNIHNNTHNKVDVKSNVHNNVHVKTGDNNNSNKNYNNNMNIAKGGDQEQNQKQQQSQDQSQSSVNNNTLNGGTQTTSVVASGGGGGNANSSSNSSVGDVSNTVIFEGDESYTREHIVTTPEETFSPAPNYEPTEEWNTGAVEPMKFTRVASQNETIEWIKKRCRFNVGFARGKTDSIVTVGKVAPGSEYIGRCNVVAHYDYDIVDVQSALSVIGMNEGATKMKVVDITGRSVAVTYSKNLGTRGGASILAGPIGEIAGHTGGGTNMGSGEVLKENEPGMIVEFYQ